MPNASRRSCWLLLLIVGGCAATPDASTMAGTYVMHQTGASDTLVLRPDGRYVRMYHPVTEAAAVDSGGWFVSKNHKLLALKDFPKRWRWVHDCMGIGIPNCTAMSQPNGLTLAIERSWYGRRRLGWHSDFGWYYTRL